ncbi:MAG: shikimate dehydrogenase [Legionella sp.]|nr:shikimate dehydrogenase [Legionella sp.]
MLDRYAVIGAPIAHSLSPMLHQQFAETSGIMLRYDCILLNPACFGQQVHAFFEAGGCGLNITAPGKIRAFDLAKIKTKRCLKAGAANTLWLDTHQRICADNTDGIGLVRDLNTRIQLQDARILCLGAGGAARGIVPALLTQNPKQISIYNRTEARARAWINTLQDKRVQYINLENNLGAYDLVINTIPTCRGLSAASFLTNKPFCYDLSYDVSGLTPFVAFARRYGCQAVDGFGMLVQQAAEAFFVWHEVRQLALQSTRQD